MKSVLYLILFFFTTFIVSDLRAEDQGDILFKQVCAACHSINKGRLVGPDLANVHKRRSEAWIIKFVTSSQSMIKRGDPQANALFKEYNNVIMPDPNLTENQIKSIITYIKSESSEIVADVSGDTDLSEEKILFPLLQ